tara:strand:- start:1354 stop:1737 length:384 start_codon:yes stop_codon:yes gene_type:complete
MTEQRFNISYSVDLDELAVEVQRLLSRSTKEMESAISDFNELNGEEPLVMQTCETIDNIHVRLRKTIDILNDASAIVKGYINYKSSPQTADAPAPTVSANPPNIQELQGMLDALQGLKSETSAQSDE